MKGGMAAVSNSGNKPLLLTNVAIVRLRKNGKRFEVAAYKNKVVNWRSGAETDLANVLQISAVFQNVSRGIRATGADLMAAFGTEDQAECARFILSKGELEKGELERGAEFDNLFRDVAATVAEKCVNPTTARPYTVNFIEAALRDAHFSVVPGKPAKSQALKAIAALRDVINIERAKIALRVNTPVHSIAVTRSWLNARACGRGAYWRMRARKAVINSPSPSPPPHAHIHTAKFVDFFAYCAVNMNLIVGETRIVTDIAPGENEIVSLDLVADPGFFREIEDGVFRAREL